MQIRPLSPDDEAAVRALTELSFAASNLGHNGEADLIEALRDQEAVCLELVTEAERGEIIGHILFSRLESSGVGEIASLAPMSVAPERQGQGVGSALIREGLRCLQADGFGGVVVLGDPHFYSRFGFSVEAAMRLKAPFGGPAFMAIGFVSGALDDREIVYPPAFGV